VGRARRIALIALAVVLFLALSGVLARFLTVENLERDEELALLQAQARGNASGMLAHLHGCRQDPSCVATVQADARTLRRPGAVKIVMLTSPTAYSLGGATGTTRLAWTVIGQFPVVQCVRVRREGSFLAGISLKLLSVSAPIAKTAEC